MSAPTITTPPATPNRGSATFPSEVATFLSFFGPFVSDLNAFSSYLNSTALVSYAFGDGTATLPTIRFASDSNTGLYRPAADTLGFATGGAERMRIDSAGNVGIGTSAPAADLEIGAGSDRTFQIGSAGATRGVISTDGVNGTVSIGATNDSSTGSLIFKTGANLNERMRIADNGSLLIAGRGTASLPVVRFGSDVTSGLFSPAAGELAFSSGGSERMRFNASGTFLVGTSSIEGSGGTTIHNVGYITTNRGSTGSAAHHVFMNPNGVVGSIQSSGTATSYNTSSDYRLKEDWRDIDAASAKLMALKPVNFAWKADGTRTDGFLAHELAEVIPNAVTGEKDGEEMQSVDHSKIVPLLTAALQEALARIEALEARAV